MSSVSSTSAMLPYYAAFANSPQPSSPITQGNPEGNPCGVGFDLDETGHAALPLFMGSANAAFHEHAHHQMTLAQNGHLTSSLAYDPLARSAHGLAGVTGGCVLVAPLGLFALHAGRSEWKDSREKAVQIVKRNASLINEAACLGSLSASTRLHLANNVGRASNAAQQRVRDNAVYGRLNKYNGLIGAFSFLSGMAIVSRVAVELARNLGGALASGSTDVYSAAEKKLLPRPFSEGSGLASNALAVLASGFAVALGVSFLRKSRALNKAWKTDSPHLLALREKHIAANSKYGSFVAAKTAHRRDFAKSFHFKNRMFVAGTALYAAGTIVPVCVKLLAAAGVLSSHKVGANLILALFATGIAGAVIMGLFSHQFFYGHPSVGRYEEHRIKHVNDLERRFLTGIDSFHFPEDASDTDAAVKRGVAMREAAYLSFHANELTREGFLREIASRTNRKFIHIAHVGDGDYSNFRPLATKLRAKLNGGQLREKDVAEWASKVTNQTKIQQVFKQIVDSKIAYLARSDKLMERMHRQIMGDAKSGPLYDERLAFSKLTIGADVQTSKRLAAYRTISESLAVPQSRATFAKTMDEIFELHENPDPDEKPNNKPEPPLGERIASHLMQTMPQDYNHARGCLLEIENQATKQRIEHAKVPLHVK